MVTRTNIEEEPTEWGHRLQYKPDRVANPSQLSPKGKNIEIVYIYFKTFASTWMLKEQYVDMKHDLFKKQTKEAANIKSQLFCPPVYIYIIPNMHQSNHKSDMIYRVNLFYMFI